MENWQGKHFSITDPKGVNTVIYEVYETNKEYLKDYPKYTVERLEYSEELRGELKKKTFYVEDPQEDGNQLVILSFAKDKVVVNTGLLLGDSVKITKTPMPLKFDTMYSEEITIIDPETTEEVKPRLYFDEQTNEVKGKCKLKPYKSYFSFEIREDK